MNYENLRTLRKTCTVSAIVAISIHFVLYWGGMNSIFCAIRVITASIAIILCSVKCGAEIMAPLEEYYASIAGIVLCSLGIIVNVAMLVYV